MGFFTLIDARPYLPDNWAQRLIGLANLATPVVKKGRGPGSLEDEATAGLNYRVLTTGAISEHAPWLYEAYTHPDLLRVLEDWVDDPLKTTDEESGINVNYLIGAGKRYELHTDQEPYTLLLFATEHEEGGRLELLPQEHGPVIQIAPRPGWGVLFDGSRIPHRVSPISDGIRVSVPMVYLVEGAARTRDAAVDDYLFAGGTDAH